MKIIFPVMVFILSACASTGQQNSFDASRSLQRAYTGENINGEFPSAIYIKTRTQTFNAYHYYLLSGGLIWYKSIDPGKEPKNWMLFEKTGLPHNDKNKSFIKTNTVAAISADADELTALSGEGVFYRYCFDATIAHPSKVWIDRQGWPKAEQLHLDGRTAAHTAWAVGKRNAQVLYYEDVFGNQHHNGSMEIVTIYMLLEDGQEITYGDTGLPCDFSRNFIGPERGAFKAVSLSASASTMFVISESGVMYTRMADFDIIGCDPMFFKYTYIPYSSDLAGSDYFSNLTEWALPPEDWRKQPAIPLAGNAAITRRITILQNGQGNAARELRVAGRNAHGETGYWTKAIFADDWEFQTAPLVFSEEDFLQIDKRETLYDEKRNSLDKYYRGYWWNGTEKENDCAYEIPNFNILEGDCELRVTYQNETSILKLHPVEMWTYLKRDYLPGRDGPPKLFFVTLEIPENALNGLSDGFVRLIKDKFAGNNNSLFKYIIAASTRFIILRSTEDAHTDSSALFLTDGSVSDYFPEFRRGWYTANYDELRRYVSPELTVNSDAITSEELHRTITLNKTFRAELKTRIADLRNDKADALKLDMIYIPLHYIVRLTPLRFVDAPKIRTVTNYGEKIVLANSRYTEIISDTRIWVMQKILELLETRILCYEEIANNTSGVSIPGYYSETITGFWDIAGLPHRITGNFSSARGEIPAVLQFHTGEENGGLLGWYLSAGDSGSFTFFLDPKKSAKTIYSRRGKTPEQRGFTKKNAVKINCTLYINPGRTRALEQRIIENSIQPFYRIDQEGIDVSITYNGEVFEIRESPARHGNTLIFRGSAL